MITNEKLADIASKAMLHKLDAQQYANHNKHVVDYLPETVRRALFDGLEVEATSETKIHLEGTLPRTLKFIPRDSYDLVPFLVVDDVDAGGSATNVGTEGFASSLRDFFAEGAERHRVLLVLTPGGNETQESAQDAADKELVGIETLCQEVARRHNLGGNYRLTQIVDAFLDYTTRDSWSHRLDRLEEFVGAIEGRPTAEWGSELHRLGCFFADQSDEFLDGRIPRLHRSVTDRRVGDRTRLRTNGATYLAVREVFDDPLQPNTVEGLNKIIDQGSASHADLVGPEELGTLDFETFDKPESSKREKNSFEFDHDSFEVVGANESHWMPGKDGSTRILLVAAKDRFSIRAPLAHEHRVQSEYLRLIGWQDETYSSLSDASETDADGLIAVYSVPCDDDFAIFRAVISKGPRTYKKFDDDFLVVVYRTEHASVAWEVGADLSIEHQSWVREGDAASFKIAREAETQRQTVRLDSFEYNPEDAPVDSGEIDSVITAITAGVRLDEGRLKCRICWTESVTEASEDIHPLLETAVYRSGLGNDMRERIFTALKTRKKEGDRYLDAITDSTRDPAGFWNLELGSSVRLRCRAYNDRGQEEGVARLLASPSTMRLDSHLGELKEKRFPQIDGLENFLALRENLFERLRSTAIRHDERSEDPGNGRAYVSLLLTNLAPIEDQIEAYLQSWNAAFNKASQEVGPFQQLHETLLQLDTVVFRDNEGRALGLSVLPTHPWVLRSLLSFQKIADQAYQRSRNHADLRSDQITEVEFTQLAATKVIENWYFENSHFRAEDGAPFTFDFVPVGRYVSEARLDYVSRVIRKKIQRYLHMHGHLRDARRTLRIAFVNPGDAKHLFDGIVQWLKNSKPRDDEEYESWLARTPQIEVFLFSAEQDSNRANEFDRFFMSHLDSSDIKDLNQVLLTKLRYGKRRKPYPQDQNDYVHLTFVHGLVKNANRKDIQGDVADGWDGCFGDGLMATNIRRTKRTAVGGERLVSQRGLWIGSQQNSRRAGIANLLALLRGAKTGEIKPGGSVFTQVELPGLSELNPMYENSDWVVHLDRELSLELFRRWGSEGPKIIEYSDQEDPLSPGFDVITVTQHAKAYYEQLDSVLKYASLTPEHTMTREEREAARREGDRLLEEINTLSGSWALDFLMGSIAQPGFRNRLVGNVGSALVFRWLRRVEEAALKAKHGDQVVPVYISLEDIIRATPASGLQTRHGMAYRYSKPEASNYCDDLLVLYMTPAKEGVEYKIFGRIIEVKFGTNAASQDKKAIGQVKGTYDLLKEHLSGDRRPLEAPFRHRQLSLLIKSQLEQSVSTGILSYERVENLNLPLVSAKLASGDYVVDYTLGEGTRQAYGDAFLLTTSGDVDEDKIVRTNSGVRLITLDRSILHWLAYTSSPTPANPLPRNTLPELGTFGSSLEDLLEGRGETVSSLGSLDSEGGVLVDDEQVSIEPAAVEGHDDDSDAHDEEHTEKGNEESPSNRDGVSLEFASGTAVREVTRNGAQLTEITGRLSSSFEGQGIKLAEPPSAREIELGPRLIRVFVRLDPSEKITSVRNRSEDIARNVGTLTSDIHIVNVPEKRAIALDLPIPGMEYSVNYHHLLKHISFEAAHRELELGFCAGVDLTGKPVWVDLQEMPHMMVAGTTGSGKTVFLRALILTLMLHHEAAELDIRLSSSKPMDFLAFMDAPHTQRGELCRDAQAAAALVESLVLEMERRIEAMTQAIATNLKRYNAKVADVDRLPHIVAVIDEFSETVLSFDDSEMRKQFENNVARLAQKARAAGIHLVLCMQRPDANVVKGAVKANILHRFALKLPSKTDSMVILDETGAEALLGKGDLLYKSANGKTFRLQVPYLDDRTLEETIETL